MALLDKYKGTWSHSHAKHYLKRTMFGVKHQDIEHFVSIGLENTLNETIILSFEPYTQPLNHYQSYNPDPNAGFGQPWLQTPYSAKHNGDRVNSVENWWLERILQQSPTITEKMVVFWHNHFGVSHRATLDARNNHQYYELLRKYALTNFRQLIREMTAQPLMLQFLNGYANSARFPDENYARELMELFTLGKGPESKYTEKDVQEAAKVLSGFVHDTASGTAAFFHNRHNADTKVFSDFFDNTKIEGIGPPMPWTDEIYPLIDMILKKDEVSKFICRKIYRFFVFHNIDQTIENEIIEPLAKIFRENSFNVQPVLKTLLGSQHFYDAENIMGAMIKSPLDYYFGIIKELNPILPQSLEKKLDFYDTTRGHLSDLQQPLCEPPNVAGWPAFYHYPNFYRNWINSETVKVRANLIDTFFDKYTSANNSELHIDLPRLVKTFDKADDPNELITFFIKYAFSFEPESNLIVTLKKILLSGQDGDFYWTQAWNEYLAKPDDATTKQVVESRLKLFFRTLLKSSEYQLN